jgi:hypothetical protein
MRLQITMRFALPLTTFAPVKTGALPERVGQRDGEVERCMAGPTMRAAPVREPLNVIRKAA